jgi:hypothetical protein
MDGFYSDGLIKNEFHFDAHDETMHVKQVQPSEQLILDRNAELRRNKGAVNDLGASEGKAWGRYAASIPWIMYNKVCTEGVYNLQKDKDLKKWLRETPEGQSCLV